MKHFLSVMTLFLIIPSCIHGYALVFEYENNGCRPDTAHLYANISGLNISASYDVKASQKGRGAEWNWQDIEKKSGGKVKKGDLLDLRIVTKTYPPQIIYEGKIPSDGLIGFWLDAKHCIDGNKCFCAIPASVKIMSNQEAKQYYQPVK